MSPNEPTSFRKSVGSLFAAHLRLVRGTMSFPLGFKFRCSVGQGITLEDERTDRR